MSLFAEAAIKAKLDLMKENGIDINITEDAVDVFKTIVSHNGMACMEIAVWNEQLVSKRKWPRFWKKEYFVQTIGNTAIGLTKPTRKDFPRKVVCFSVHTCESKLAAKEAMR
jgi:hypothetical protein